MSILSVLGKIGAGIAAPFTGGASLAALPIIEGIGSALGSGAASSKANRLGEADMQARMDALNNRAMVDAAQHNLTAGSTRLGQVQRADVASSMKDAPLTGDARIDKFSGGGLRPSAFGQDSRTAADVQKRQALAALMSGSDQITPKVSGIPDAGLLEKIGGIAGIVGGGAGIARGIGQIAQMRPVMYGQDFKPIEEENPLYSKPVTRMG